jgi:hypothetical protein
MTDFPDSTFLIELARDCFACAAITGLPSEAEAGREYLALARAAVAAPPDADSVEGCNTTLKPPPRSVRQRKPRRSTLASVAKQASKAAIGVARYEVKPDGSIVIVTGNGEFTESNPWLDDLKVTKQ